jgi:hypothetical protein
MLLERKGWRKALTRRSYGAYQFQLSLLEDIVKPTNSVKRAKKNSGY